MKVELDDITLGHSTLSDSVFAGIPLKDGKWRHKKNVTNEFIACVISRWEGHVESISNDHGTWEISVKKIK